MTTQRFTIVLRLLAALAAALLLALPLPAQQPDRESDGEPSVAAGDLLDEPENDERGDEASEEEDERLDELFEVRESLTERLQRLREEAARVRKRLAGIDEHIAVVRQLSELEQGIAAAERQGDDALVEQLSRQFQRFEIEVDVRSQILELEFELSEVEESITEADREEDEERLELLKVLRGGLDRIREITRQLLPIYLDGPEDAEGPLEQQKAVTFTNNVEKAFRALQVLEELREAEEAEDDALFQQLEAKLDVLRTDMGILDERVGPRADQADLVQPILITEATLAPYADADLHADVAPLLRRYCVDCHGNDESSGELNLEKLLAASPIVKHRDAWINVIEQAKNHVMPPEDETQPTQDERRQIVLSLHNALYNFDYSHIRDPGYEAARRLTHREYSNTVRDLFGLEIDVVDRFPDDLTATSGFDNSANSLFIQPLLMERYIGIAEYVVTTALPPSPTTPTQKRVHARIFSPAADVSNVSEAAQSVLDTFLLRAFRRPPGAAELSRLVQQVEGAVAAGATFEQAIKAVIQTALISPSFLLRTENARPNEFGAFAITSWELASRLSYFLWASMPDDELFELARSGRLPEPSVLAAQVDRMLADPKADSLGSVFAAQWLGSHHLGVRVRLDPIDNPWCTETLMAAMREETAMFFNALVRENRPIPELIDANFTFLNEELAKLYRIPSVEGPQMRRVELETDLRGGIFGQGSLLAVTSFPYRTSPVVRGKWILDTVLGTPPPPPPPNVSELPEEIEENRRLSFREKLELHRQKSNCYACHSQMDPLGFSLQQYDWFGRYRTRLGRKRIDARGTLPNGTEFKGLAGLKQVVVEQRRADLVRQLSQKMLSYALGRQLEYYDEPAIRAIVGRVSKDGDRLQTLVGEIVKSFPFQYKQHRAASTSVSSAQGADSHVNLIAGP